VEIKPTRTGGSADETGERGDPGETIDESVHEPGFTEGKLEPKSEPVDELIPGLGF
jgi:hypothetical protein